MKKKSLFYNIFASLTYFSILLFTCFLIFAICGNVYSIDSIYSSNLAYNYSSLGILGASSSGGYDLSFSPIPTYAQCMPNPTRPIPISLITCILKCKLPFGSIQDSSSFLGAGGYSLPVQYSGYGVDSLSGMYEDISGLYSGVPGSYRVGYGLQSYPSIMSFQTLSFQGTEIYNGYGSFSSLYPSVFDSQNILDQWGIHTPFFPGPTRPIPLTYACPPLFPSENFLFDSDTDYIHLRLRIPASSPPAF